MIICNQNTKTVKGQNQETWKQETEWNEMNSMIRQNQGRYNPVY